MTLLEVHLYDSIEPDLVNGEALIFCSVDINRVEGRLGVYRVFASEEIVVDSFDKFPPFFVRIDGDNPVVPDFVLP